MKEMRIKDFRELYDLLEQYRHDHRWKFRGQGNQEWKLIPKVGRSRKMLKAERSIFQSWKDAAIAHLPLQPVDDWGWLAIGQHHELATRMLDWTHHVLAAAFFAVSSKQDADAAIYAYRPSEVFSKGTIDPLSYEGIAFYAPMAYVPRIARQAALFTVHGPPDLSLDDYAESDQLHKIVIDKEYCEEFLFVLSQLGFNWATLFPDLDGLSRHFNWVGANLDQLEPIRTEGAI